MAQQQQQQPVDPESSFQHLLDFRAEAKSICKTLVRLRETGNMYSAESVALADQLQKLITPNMDRQSNLARWLVYFSSTLKAAASQQDQMTEQVAALTEGPLEVFVEIDYQELLELRKRKERLASECEAMHARALGKKDNVPTTAELERLSQQLAALESQFANKMAQLEKRRETRFLRTMLDMMRLQYAYHEKAWKVFCNLKKKMDDLEHNLDEVEWDKPLREGWLQKRSQMGNHRVFVSVRQGSLWQYRKDKEFNPDGRVELITATVRLTPAGDDGTEPSAWRFEVHSPKLPKPLLLAADSEKERSEWIKAIQAAISSSLSSLNVPGAHDADSVDPALLGQVAASTSSSPTPAASGGGTALPDRAQDFLRSVPGNATCADCDAPDPTWASINLGILVCLDCSGVHRSLGTHISKVRSLSLDRWSLETLLFMKNRGNRKSNALYEACLGDARKPTPTSDRALRDSFIQDKYVRKTFVPRTQNTREELSKDLQVAAQRRDTAAVDVIMRLIAQGADPNFVSLDADKRTAAFEPLVRGNLLSLEALLQNGASTAAVDARGWTLLHYAAFYNRPRCLMRLLDVTKLRADNAGLFPVDVASWNCSTECLSVLKGSAPPNVELTLELVENGTNPHEDVFSIPKAIMLPNLSACDNIPRAWSNSSPRGSGPIPGGATNVAPFTAAVRPTAQQQARPIAQPHRRMPHNSVMIGSATSLAAMVAADPSMLSSSMPPAAGAPRGRPGYPPPQTPSWGEYAGSQDAQSFSHVRTSSGKSGDAVDGGRR